MSNSKVLIMDAGIYSAAQREIGRLNSFNEQHCSQHSDRAQKRKPAGDQKIEWITPPSTRSAAPLVTAESGLAMNVTSEATSSVEAKRLSNEPGRTVSKNSFSTTDCSMPRDRAI